MWVVVILVLLILLMQTREGFEIPETTNPLLVSMAAPGANLETYVAIVKDFYNTIYVYDQRTPTREEAIAYLANQSIRKEDRVALAEILPTMFKDLPPEKQTAKFKPDGTKLQPEMAAEPVADNAKPAGYETSDKDPVMPKSKVMDQRQSLNRDGMSPHSGRPDTVMSVPGKKHNPYVPKIGTVEHMSTMAGTITQTNEIYGPRLPKQKYSEEMPRPVEHPPRMYPKLYGPGNPPGSELGGASRPSGLKPAEVPMDSIYESKEGEVGAGDLSIISQGPDYKSPTRVNTYNSIKMEPVPFLNDFSKFYR